MNDTRRSRRVPRTGAGERLGFAMIPAGKLVMPDALYDTDAGIGDAVDVVLPCVVCRAPRSGHYVVLDGYKRVRRLKRKRSTAVPCAVLDRVLSRRDRGVLRIVLNRGRRFSLNEKVLFVRWLTAECDGKTRARALCDIGVTEQEAGALALVASAGKQVRDAVAGGMLHLPLIRTFMLLSSADRKTFLDTFRGARLSLQNQREFLEWLTEMAYEGRTAVSTILNQPDITAILKNRVLNWPQRIEKIRACLYRRRFPRLEAAMKKWEKIAAAARPSPSVKFIPGANFEKNRLTVQCTVIEPAAARRTFEQLSAVPEKVWEGLIYPLGEG